MFALTIVSRLQQKPNIRLSEVPAFRMTLLAFGTLLVHGQVPYFFLHIFEALPLSQNMCCHVAVVGLDIYEESTIPVIKDKIRVIPVLNSY